VIKIEPKIMTEAVKYFKEHGIMTSALAMRRYKLQCKAALHLCTIIEKRFPNLWREGKERFYAGN